LASLLLATCHLFSLTSGSEEQHQFPFLFPQWFDFRMRDSTGGKTSNKPEMIYENLLAGLCPMLAKNTLNSMSQQYSNV
jgi:hypothetical protein